MAVAIFSGFNQINEIRNNSNWSQGKGSFNSWTYMAKANSNVVDIAGNLNILPTGVNLINDLDLFDTLLTEASFKGSIGPSIVEAV